MADLLACRLTETVPFTHYERGGEGDIFGLLSKEEVRSRDMGLCLLAWQAGLCILKRRSLCILTRLSLH